MCHEERAAGHITPPDVEKPTHLVGGLRELLPTGTMVLSTSSSSVTKMASASLSASQRLNSTSFSSVERPANSSGCALRMR
jgi:hypothetical protein